MALLFLFELGDAQRVVVVGLLGFLLLVPDRRDAGLLAGDLLLTASRAALHQFQDCLPQLRSPLIAQTKIRPVLRHRVLDALDGHVALPTTGGIVLATEAIEVGVLAAVPVGVDDAEAPT